jgi:hypothetical protein
MRLTHALVLRTAVIFAISIEASGSSPTYATQVESKSKNTKPKHKKPRYSKTPSPGSR